MVRKKKMPSPVSCFVRAAMAGVLAVGMAPAIAFADVTAGTIDDSGAMSTDGYVIAAAFAAAEPAPELLGLNNPNFRNTGEADNIGAMFGKTDINENPDPYVYNYMNEKTPGIYIGGRSGGPMAALVAYDSDNAEAAQNAVWNLLPHIVLGTGSDDIPDNEHDFYNTDAYARAVETANNLDANSYNPIGVTYNRISLPTMIQTMYRLAAAANEVTTADSSLKTRYEDPLEIAKDYERYILGQKGVVQQAIDTSDKVKKKTVALVESYDSTAGTYTIITDGVAEGTATTNRYLEAVQGVTNNYYDTVGEAGAKAVTADALKSNVDVIIVGGNAGSGTESLSDILTKDGLIDKTYYCVNWANGSVFGTTVNSVENAQNVGRILPCVYPEVLDQSDMISYYYDVFYHIKDGKIADMIAEKMDGVRNWNHTDSASLTAWETTDYAGYDHAKVETLLKSGVAYLNSQTGLSAYMTPTSYLASDTEIKDVEIIEGSIDQPSSGDTKTDPSKDSAVAAPKAQTITATDVTKTFGDAAFALGAKTSGDGKLTYATSNAKVATVAADGKVTIVGAGSATITVTAAATTNYAKATKDVKVTVKPAAQTITASAAKSVAMGKTVALGAKASAGGALSYKSSNTKVAKVSAKGVVTPVKAGTATITVTAAAKGNYAKATKAVKVTVKAGTQALTFKKQSKPVKLAKVKKAKQTVAITKAKGAKTAVTYSIAKVSKKKANFSINKTTGKITVKKGTPKGTYKVTVKAAAKKTANWKAASKTAVVTIAVK